MGFFYYFGAQQRLNCNAVPDFETVKVFFPPVARRKFIEEGAPSSQSTKVRKDSTTAKPKYLITLSKLPPRS